MRIPLRHILFLLPLLVFSYHGDGAERIDGTYHDPVHRQRLKSLREQARTQASKGLNRYALENLREYNILSDSLFGKELADTVDAFERQFNQFAAGRLKKLEEHRITVKESVKQREAAQARFLSLLWKSICALAVWLVIVVVLFRRRKKNARQADLDLERAKVQLATYSNEAKKGRQLKDEMEAESGPLSTVVAAMDRAVTSLPDSVTEAVQAARKLQAAVQREVSLTDDVVSIERDDSEEKTVCSINELCDHYLEISYRGHCMDPSAPFQCTVSRDLERNMQPVPLHPAGTATVLMNILDNAFRAVKERASREEKGYQPSIAVSTRILPRFVQVRIKDNGDGIPDDIREKVMDEFYSTRQSGEGAGAGLAEAKRILTTLHNGEIVIESESGKGTDVYLKIYR